MKKTEKLQLAYIFIYLGLLLVGLVLLFVFPGLVSTLSFLGFLLLGYLGLAFVRSRCNEYTCSKCNHKFTIGMFKDIFSKSGGTLGKKLKCPKCGNIDYMKEEAK